MGDITIEKLLNNFADVLNEINEIVAKKDINAARKALEQIESLVNDETKITLDDRKDIAYDHVLHELLAKISGVIEIEKKVQEQDPDISDLLKRKKEIEDKLKQQDTASSDVDKIKEQIKELEELRKRAIRAEDEATTDEEKAIAEKERISCTYKIRDLEKKLKELSISKDKAVDKEEIKKKIDELTKRRIEIANEEKKNKNDPTKDDFQKDQILMDLKQKKDYCNEEIRRLENNLKDLENSNISPNKEKLEKELEEIKRKLKEYSISDRLDLGKEAARIGDKIFKTHEIREELSNRNISREDFKAFYTQGRDSAMQIVDKISEDMRMMREETNQIFVDSSSDINLITQLAEAKANKDEALTIKIYEQIRQRMAQVERLKESLKDLNFLENPINTIELGQQFNNNFLDKYLESMQNRHNELQNQLNEQVENFNIFNKEIQIINEEEKSIADANSEKLEHLETDAKAEKNLRARQIRATMFGDKELEEEWNTRVRRFYSHRISVPYIRGEKSQGFEIETIEPYAEYEEDIKFLNLNDYKRYLEISSIYKNSGKNIDYMLSILDQDTVNEYRQLEEKNGKEMADKWLDEYMAEKSEYVSTFHGFTNQYGVKYSISKTSGSTLKAMKPVKGNLPATTKVGNAISNVFRFLGIRKPEFSRINEKGEKVSNVLGGVLTIATDAAVIGGAAAATIIGGPLALAGTYGVAYGAKGVVTLKDIIKSRIQLKKYGDEIRSNLPTLGNASKDDKEVARKDYYREVEGKNRITSWVKAKADKYIFRKRAKETEEAIVARRIKESDAVIDSRTSEALEAIQANYILAERNQQSRQENTRNEIRGQNTYNDIVRDPDSVDKKYALEQAARNAVLEGNGKQRLDLNPTSQVERKEKYVKDRAKFYETVRMKDYQLEGDSIAATSITIEEKYTAEQQRQDRTNKVLTAILTVAGRIGFDYFTTGFMKETTKLQQDPDKVVPGKDGTVQTTRTKVLKTDDELLNTKIKDLKTEGDYYNDIFYGQKMNHPNGFKSGQDTNSFSIGNYINGEQEMSIGEQVAGYTNQVQNLTSADLSEMTLGDLGKMLVENNTTTANRVSSYLASRNYAPDAKFADIVVDAIKNGDVWKQTGFDGWGKISTENLYKYVEETIKGNPIPDEIIPGGIRAITAKGFDLDKLIKSAIDGLLIGLGANTVDNLHEAAKQTKRVDPGTFEHNNPLLGTSAKYHSIMSIINRCQEEENKKRREQESQQQNKDEKDEEEIEL